MKICPVRTAFFHADGRKEGRKDGRTDGRTGTRTKRTKLIVAIGNFANVRKYLEWCSYILHCCADKANVVSDGKCQVMKEYLGVKVEIHVFLTLRQPVTGTAQ